MARRIAAIASIYILVRCIGSLGGAAKNIIISGSKAGWIGDSMPVGAVPAQDQVLNAFINAGFSTDKRLTSGGTDTLLTGRLNASR